MSKAIITPDLDAIVSEIEIAAPPERVFRALTDRAQLIRWWDNDACKCSVWEMDARVGGKWHFEASDPIGKVVINGVSDFKANGEIASMIRRACSPTPGLPTGTTSPGKARWCAGS
jgi:uncharacterized protein YndB with AHSA1/START domain